MRSLILGSSSKSRQLILNELGLNYIIISPNINEKNIGNRYNNNPSNLVLEISKAKSDYIINNSNNIIPEEYKSSILLTADTVVYHKNNIIEKPQTNEEFINNIKSYSNSFCELVSGVVITDLQNGKRVEGVDIATLHFLEFTDLAISDLIQEGKVFNCAGGIMVENPLMRPFISQIEGSEDTVMGLSKALVISLIDSLNS